MDLLGLSELLSSMLIDEPKVMRILKVLLWIGVSLLITPWLIVLKPYLYVILVIITAIVIAAHFYSTKLLNSKLSKVFLDIFKEPSGLPNFVEELGKRSLMSDIIKDLEDRSRNRDIQGILSWLASLSPLFLLPVTYAIFISFITAYTASILVQSPSNIHEFMILGLAIISITAVALAVNLDSAIGEESNQAGQENISSSTANAINGLLNEYISPRKARTSLGRVYGIAYYAVRILPKPKIRIKPPRMISGIYVCNDDLKDRMVKFIYNNENAKCDDKGSGSKGVFDKLTNVCEVLRCSNVMGLDSLLEVKSPYRFLEPDKGDPSKRPYVISLERDGRGIIMLKAWKGCVSKLRENKRNDPVRCISHRLIGIIAIGDESLINELEMILRFYSRHPTEYEFK